MNMKNRESVLPWNAACYMHRCIYSNPCLQPGPVAVPPSFAFERGQHAVHLLAKSVHLLL